MFQLHTELICDIGICKKDPDTIVAVGKDHISWWMIDQDQKSLQKIGEPDYQVLYVSVDSVYIVTSLSIRKTPISVQ